MLTMAAIHGRLSGAYAMPPLSRPKFQALYDRVKDWHESDGDIHYVAHAITTGPNRVVLIAAETAEGSGGSAGNHPDQKYWKTFKATSGALPARTIRIDIDCTLLPCDPAPQGCLYQVPILIRNAGIANMPLRIFSHRNEFPPKNAQSSKRYFECNSSDTNQTLLTQFKEHAGWGWVPWNGNYP
jgi:hypothetical protein